MNIPDETLREAYWYLINNPKGYQECLEKIHPDLVEYLIQNNIIGEGMNSHAQLRYHLTDFGRVNVEMYYRTITSNLVRKKLDEEKETWKWVEISAHFFYIQKKATNVDFFK